MIFEGLVQLKELVNEVVSTHVQVEQSQLPCGGRTSFIDLSSVKRSSDDRRVDRELLEPRQTVQDAKESSRFNSVGYLEPYTRQGVRDRPKYLSDGRRIFPRRTGIRNELGDLKGC